MNKKKPIPVYRMGTKYDVNSVVIGDIKEKLNSLQDCFLYVEKPPIVLKEIEKYSTLEKSRIINLIQKDIDKDVPAIVITNKPLERNLFGFGKKNIGIWTINNWDYFAPPSESVYIVYAFIKKTFNSFGILRNHTETRGCLYDYCGIKTDIRYKLTSGCFCDECQTKIDDAINGERLSQEQFNCIKSMLKWMSNETKKQMVSPLFKLRGYELDVELERIVVDHFKDKGFEIELEPDIEGFHPDIKAKKDDEVIVVEIMSKINLNSIARLLLYTDKLKNYKTYLAYPKQDISKNIKTILSDSGIGFMAIENNLKLNVIQEPAPIKDFEVIPFAGHDAFREQIIHEKRRPIDRKLISESLLDKFRGPFQQESNLTYKEKITEFLNAFDNTYKSLPEIILETLQSLWPAEDEKGKIFEIFRDFEKHLFRGSFYRDHFIHPFQVFLIGCLIIDKIHPKIEEIVKNKYNYLDDKEVRSIVDDTWLFASTFHDIGYPIQEFDDWIYNFFNDFLSVKLPKRLGILAPFGFSNILAIDNIMLCLNNLSSLYSYLHLQQRGENKEGWKYREDNIINYPILKMLMDNLVNRDHSVISAVSLMERLIYGIGGIKDVDYISSCISPASLAIALHDNEVYNRTEIDSIYFDDNPFTFLLIYCDALQEEGRPQQVNPIDNISPILVVKELQENNIYFILEYDEDKVTYVDNKGQEHSRFEDKAVECENIRKKLKSKNILFKIGIQLKGKSIEPVEERNYTIPKK